MLRRCLLGDLRRSWWLYLLITVFLAVIGILTVNISGNIFEVHVDDDVYAYYSDDMMDDIYNIEYEIENAELLDEDIKIYGRSKTIFSDIEGVYYTIIETPLTEVFWLPLAEGEWFDGSGPQAIVPESMADEYPVGSQFPVLKGSDTAFTATVVGVCRYDGGLNVSGRTQRNSYNSDRSENSYVGPFIEAGVRRITVCVDDLGSDAAESRYTVGIDPDKRSYIADKYGLWLRSMGETFDGYVSDTQPMIGANVYFIYMMTAGAAIIAITFSVSAGEVTRRKLGVTMLCGATRRDLMACEAIRTLSGAALAALTTAVLSTLVTDGEMLKMAPEDVWKGILAILATGAVIFAAGAIRIAKTKILDLIGGR